MPYLMATNRLLNARMTENAIDQLESLFTGLPVVGSQVVGLQV